MFKQRRIVKDEPPILVKEMRKAEIDLALNSKMIVDYDLREDLSPEMIIRHINDSYDSRVSLDVGAPIDLSLLNQKYCVGYHIRDEYHEYLPCPDRRAITKGFQCTNCTQRDVLNPCIMCNGTRCDTLRHPEAKCGTSITSVYLVSFGKELKVGVSIRERLRKRWVEQGADEGIEIGYAPNGSVARLVEDDISGSTNIRKSIRLTTKLDAIGRTDTSLCDLEELACKFYEGTKKKWPELHEGELKQVDLQGYYRLELAGPSFNFDVSDRAHIKGEILGMKGPLLFFRNDMSYVVDFRSLRGRSLGDEQSGNQPDLTSFFYVDQT